MLQTLLESRSHRQSNSFGAAASTAVHLILITAAAYGTIAHANASEAEDPAPVILKWHQDRQPSGAKVAPVRPSHTSTRTVQLVKTPSISVDISPHIPDVSIPLGAVSHDDFQVASGSANDNAPSPRGLASGNDNAAFDSYEVDVPVTALGGRAPAYPAAMRSAGIEGEVKGEFVVDKRGRPDVKSLRIISSTNDQFSNAVRDALPGMRFTPARLRGEAVAQLVQQLFVFRLSR